MQYSRWTDWWLACISLARSLREYNLWLNGTCCPVVGFCFASLQTHPTVCDGWNWCSPGLQKCVYCSTLHQGNQILLLWRVCVCSLSISCNYLFSALLLWLIFSFFLIWTNHCLKLYVLLISAFIPQERTRNAQFIVISLRNNMFELADRLVGIYKVQDCTGSVTVNPRVVPTMPTPKKLTAWETELSSF